jgi:hypothetical protein
MQSCAKIMDGGKAGCFGDAVFRQTSLRVVEVRLNTKQQSNMK